MTEKFKVACVQNCAGPDIAKNIDDSIELCRDAHRAGAALICTPEFFTCFDKTENGLLVGAFPEPDHPALPAFKSLAEELGLWILLGSLAIQVGPEKLNNRSFLVSPEGKVVTRYNKVHMFDVDLPNGEIFRESDVFEPGTNAALGLTPWGQIGLTVCYDLRFAYLYRMLAQAGALFLTVPAAFMKTTGQAHWHALLRSRAIETGCYVFAPCQFGAHGEATTYGHSLIIDPWGEVLSDAGEGRGFALADVDPKKVHQVRAMIPALQHDREIRPMAMTDLRQVSA